MSQPHPPSAFKSPDTGSCAAWLARWVGLFTMDNAWSIKLSEAGASGAEIAQAQEQGLIEVIHQGPKATGYSMIILKPKGRAAMRHLSSLPNAEVTDAHKNGEK